MSKRLLHLFLVFAPFLLPAQVTISRFDFDAVPLTQATIGPDASSVDPDAVTDGTGAYVNNNCGPLKGIDLVIPNAGGLLDQPEMGMNFRWRRQEAFARFFDRGGCSFFVASNQLFISYRTEDGLGGTIDYGPYNTGFTPPTDGNYHEYVFEYWQGPGRAEVMVDGTIVWSQDGPDNRALDWTAAGDAMVGTIMDGNCYAGGILDHAFFYIPSPLPVKFETFLLSSLDREVYLSWEMEQLSEGGTFFIERGAYPDELFQIGSLEPEYPDAVHAYTDLPGNSGTWFYRIRFQDAEGNETYSHILSAQVSGTLPPFRVGPVPTQDELIFSRSLSSGRALLLDLQGKVVREWELPLAKLGLSGLDNGTYLLKINAAEFTGIRKVVLAK